MKLGKVSQLEYIVILLKDYSMKGLLPKEIRAKRFFRNVNVKALITDLTNIVTDFKNEFTNITEANKEYLKIYPILKKLFDSEKVLPEKLVIGTTTPNMKRAKDDQ